jgi:hypothetical protein
MTLKGNYTDVDGRPADTMLWALGRREYEAAGGEDIRLKAYDIMGRPIGI